MNARRVTMAESGPPSGKALPFRFLALVPAGLGSLVLAVAVLVTISSFHQSEWGFMVLAGLLAVLAAILFRCAYRVWRQTSRSSVRELCGWVTFTSMALVSFIVERLAASGRDGLAWLVALASIPVLVVIYRTLSRLLLAGLSVLERDLREK
jgi:chromate transport protein ChrA